MKHYDSIPRIQDDGTLKGEMVWGFNKLDGQNFVASYNCKKKTWGPFGSRTVTVDENSEQFGPVVMWFNNSNYPKTLADIVKAHSGKNDVFTGVEEITFVFEWYGENSFAGKHQEGDEMHLALIDVFLKKKGYIEPNEFIDLFCEDDRIETPEVIYIGKLDMDFVNSIMENDWTEEGCRYPNVKEGVVIKRSTLLKGQRLPMCKVKTKWWLEQLHNRFPKEMWKELE